LQSTGDNTTSLNLLNQVTELTIAQFGEDHMTTAQSLHQLTQAHFLVNDIASACTTSQKAHDIFKARLGDDHPQTKETLRNVELLKVVIDNAERQKAASKAQLDRIKQATKLGGLNKYKRVDEKGNVIIAPPAATPSGHAESSATGAANSTIGAKGTLDVDELVQFINGGGSGGGGGKTARGKNGLRGKRRTGAKR
jgi:protein TIF31